jgi:hypothetical protein
VSSHNSGYFVGALKKHLAGKRYVRNANVQQAIGCRLKAHDSDFFYAWIKTLVP